MLQYVTYKEAKKVLDKYIKIMEDKVRNKAGEGEGEGGGEGKIGNIRTRRKKRGKDD
jgi:hypothetical protein